MQTSTQTKTSKSPVYKGLSRFLLYCSLLNLKGTLRLRQNFAHTPVIESPCFSCRSGLPSVKGRVVFPCGNLHPCSLDSRHSVPSCGYAASREADVPSAPVDASPCTGRTAAAAGCCSVAFAGCSPCTPAVQKADVASPLKERERNQAPILGGGDLPARANTTAWGLDG